MVDSFSAGKDTRDQASRAAGGLGRSGTGFERTQEGGGTGNFRRLWGKRGLPAEILELELEDGRLVGDLVAEFGAGVFAGSGLRLADGRLAESVVGASGGSGSGPLGVLGRFGGFRFTNENAKAQFALRERMRKERLLALSRLGFRNTILTGPQGVTARAPVSRGALDPA